MSIWHYEIDYIEPLKKRFGINSIGSYMFGAWANIYQRLCNQFLNMQLQSMCNTIIFLLELFDVYLNNHNCIAWNIDGIREFIEQEHTIKKI